MIRDRRRFMAAGLCAGVTGALAATVGCLPNSRQPESNPRAQADDYDADKDSTATIGAKTVMGNTEPIPVSAVGLVYNLKGTGSTPPTDGWREQLEKALKRRKLNPKEILDDSRLTTSLVLVSGTIPPGARTGEKIDVTVELPQGSRTTSLKHGVLDLCELTNYELTGNIRQSLQQAGFGEGKAPLASADSLLLGSKMATAEGPLVAGSVTPLKAASAGNSADPDADAPPATDNPSLRVAKVWGGMTNLYNRPYHFLLNGEGPQPRLAMVIAARMNSVFHGTGDKSGKVAEATVRGRPMVMAAVPPAYRLNHQRFVLVARNIPLTAAGPNDPSRKKLQQELLQPETTITAAIKLEALGSDAEGILRDGLTSDSPWVKFASAQALCYLGKADPKVAQVLGEVAERHPSLRTHALTALASQDDMPCLDQLVDLMRRGDPGLRYGAYTALRAADENHEAVRGRRMGNSYWLHTVAADSDPLIHLTTERRNEIVLFGNMWPLTGGFAFPLGNEFTVTRKEGDDSVLVSRVVTRDGEPTTVEAKYRADLAVILKGLAEMGGTYSDAIEFIRRVQSADGFGCKLAVDSLPRGYEVQELARMAGRDPTAAEADKLIVKLTSGGGKDGKDVVQAGGFELSDPADGLRKKPAAPPAPSLARNPGSVFDLIK